MIVVDAEKLRYMMQKKGFANFEAIAAKAKELELDLGIATIYNRAANKNWTRDKLQTLCQILDCDPRDFVYFEREAPKAVAPTPRNEITANVTA